MTSRTRPRLRAAAIAAALAVAVGGAAVSRIASAADPATPTSVVPVTPFRVLDTRNGTGTGGNAAPITAGATLDLQIAGIGTVPLDAVGVILNITGTNTSAPTFITAWPTGQPRPDASVLNLTPGIDAPNGVTALLGDNGKVSLFNSTGTTHLIADVAGYLIPTTNGTPGPQGPQGPAGPQGPGGIDSVQVVENPGIVVAGQFTGSQVVACPAGTIITGGGGSTVLSGIALMESRPLGTVGWRATFATTNELASPNNQPFSVFVICTPVGG